MTRNEELIAKEQRVFAMLQREALDGLLLSKTGNFAWMTCGGGNYVAVNADTGVAHALVTRDGKWIVCDNIEARRVTEEEVGGLGFASESWQWHEDGLTGALERAALGARLASDTGRSATRNLDALMAPLRASLLPAEIERYRRLGALTAEAMTEACRRVQPGMTEHQAAGILGGEMLARGVYPVVLLIAADERAFDYRHPLPTGKEVRDHVMLVTCGCRWGLIASITRLVHFGRLPAELRRKHDAVTMVDATLIANTRPGARIGDIFDAALAAYAAAGFPDEWRLHHQGGPTGYVGREFRATSASDQVVVHEQAFAWNPSIAGTKSEDTIIASADGPEVITLTPRLPTVDVEVGGAVIARADIVAG